MVNIPIRTRVKKVLVVYSDLRGIEAVFTYDEKDVLKR